MRVLSHSSVDTVLSACPVSSWVLTRGVQEATPVIGKSLVAKLDIASAVEVV